MPSYDTPAGQYHTTVVSKRATGAVEEIMLLRRRAGIIPLRVQSFPTSFAVESSWVRDQEK